MHIHFQILLFSLKLFFVEHTANFSEILEHTKTILKQAQKEYHIFMMGKINVPKLANFPEIEMFVIIACPETSLIDRNEFGRPIITPFELELAFVKYKFHMISYLLSHYRNFQKVCLVENSLTIFRFTEEKNGVLSIQLISEKF
jgi:hypothetical protein